MWLTPQLIEDISNLVVQQDNVSACYKFGVRILWMLLDRSTGNVAKCVGGVGLSPKNLRVTNDAYIEHFSSYTNYHNAH